MIQRSLTNQNSDNTILGIPFQNNPTANDQIIIYQLDSNGNGYYIFGNISSAGGINVVQTSGIGASIVNSLVGGTLTLKSILSTTPNIGINNLSNQLELTLGPTLTNIFSITNVNPLEVFPGIQTYQYELTSGGSAPLTPYDFMIYEATGTYYLSINDNGTNTNRELLFECIKGGTTTVPMTIKNNGDIMVNLPPIVPLSFVGIDNTGKLGAFTSSTSLISAIQNAGTGTGQVWRDTISGVANLRSLKGDTNINISNATNEINVNLNTALNNISSINLSSQATPLDIASSRVQFESDIITFPGVGLETGVQYYYGENPTGQMIKITPPTDSGITTINTSGVGDSIVKSVVGNTATLKSINGTNSINISDDTNTLTLSLDPVLNNVTQILTPGGNLTMSASNINLANTPLATSTVNAAVFDLLGNLRYAPFYNIFQSIGGGSSLIENTTANTVNFRSLAGSSNITLNSSGGLTTISTPTTLTDIQTINSATSGKTIFNNGLTLNSATTNPSPTYYLTLDASNNVNKTAPASFVDTNIYNTDGTMTALNRIVTGNTPGSVNNKITMSNVVHSYVNSIRLNPNYLATSVLGKELNFMQFYDSLGDPWGKYEATNCETRVVDLPALGASGNYNLFYTSYANGSPAQLASWNLRVYAYESDATLLTPWSGIYQINISSYNNTLSSQSVVPESSQANKNYLLECGQAIGGNQYTLYLRIRNIGTTSLPSTLRIKIESYTNGDKVITTPLTTGNIARTTVSASLETSMKIIGSTTVGVNASNAPTSILWTYAYYPRSVRVYYFLSASSNAANAATTITFFSNTQQVHQQILRTGPGIFNPNTSISGSFIIDGYTGFANGALQALNNLTINQSNNINQNFTNMSYTYVLEFI